MKVNSMTITLTDAVMQVSNTVTCLGVVIDSQLTFAENVNKLAGSCFYQLRQLRTVAHWPLMLQRHWSTPWFQAAWTLQCNSVLYGMCKPVFVHFSRFKTQRRDSLLANESLIILSAPCATTFIGCQWDNVYCSNCVHWSVSVFVVLHRHTCLICVFQCRR